MAKQLNQVNVNLAFTAETGKAKAQLQDLQKSLQKLINDSASSSNSLHFTKDIQEATAAAAQLKVQLQAATNVNTGNLDLSKFQEQLKKSGKELGDYQNALFQLGPAGEKAFADLSKSIILAEVPLKRTNKLISEMWVSLKNAARWQISSSVLHGFMGALQGAYGYAQDLNESLNNIRIVTGQNVDQMAEFAEKANKAAKALSTTTTAYTNAALIYYQQGDKDSTVLEKTDVTAKMANVTGTSAEEVSNQLTAIWNNFNKSGQESYEKYADILTALGAATASSTDEIAGGLEKFASIADVIGLSYEYATSALATVTATTRQSEEVVGTAFKTIFARIQGLNLGETLDDGTSLNKYSEALAKVGISIYDQTGELKEMDAILDEMGNKWAQLSKDQQVALAQTVAGTRQYNQLVSLMDNWDYFNQNLEVAKNAEGTLNEQAEIYAESWEAAKKRVKASAESVYSAILDDEFFIKITNGFAEILDGVEDFIDGMGGVKGVLLTIGAITTRVFQKQIASSLSNFAYDIKMLSKEARKKELEQKEEASQLLIDRAKDFGDTTSGKIKVDAYEGLAKTQLAYINNVEKMSQEEQAINQLLMDRNRQLADGLVKEGEKLELIEQQIKAEKKAVIERIKNKTSGKVDEEKSKNLINKYGKNKQGFQKLDNINLDKTFVQGSQAAKQFKTEVEDVIKELVGLEKLDDKADETIAKIFKKDFGVDMDKSDIKQFVEELKKSEPNIEKLKEKFIVLKDDMNKTANAARTNLTKALQENGYSADQAEKELAEYDKLIQEHGVHSKQVADKLKQYGVDVEHLSNKFNNTKKEAIGFANGISKASGAIMSAGQIFSQVNGIIDVFNDTTATSKDKTVALVSGFGMLIPAIQGVVSGFSKTIVVAGLAMWQLTLIVGAIALLTAGIAYLATAETKAEKASRNAVEAAEELAEASEKAADQVESLKSAFDNYETLVDKLNACTKGTTEWYEVLKEVNDEVLSILENYPELASLIEYSRDENGVLTIDNFDEIIAQAENRATNAKYASILGQTQKKSTEEEEEREKFRIKIRSNAITSSKYTSSMTNSNVSDDLSRYAWDEVISNNIQKLSGLSLEEFENNLRELTKEAKDSKYGYTEEEYNKEIKKLLSYQENINNLVKDYNDVTNDFKTVSELITESELAGKDYDSAVKTKAAEEYLENFQKSFDKWLTKGKSFNRTSEYESNADFKALWDTYIEKTGKNYTIDKENGVIGGPDDRKFQYYDENNKLQTIELETIANEIATAEALEELGNSAEKVNKLFNNLSDRSKDLASSLVLNKDAITGEYSSANFFANLTTGDLKGIRNELSQSYGGHVDKEALMALGFKDENELVTLARELGFNNIGEVVSLFINDIDKVLDSFTDTENFQLGRSKVKTGNLTVQEQKDFANARAGLSGISYYYANHIETDDKNSENVSGLTSFYEGLASINLYSEEAGNQILELAKQYDITGDSLNEFINRVNGFDKTFDISTKNIVTQAKEIKDVIGDGLAVGDIIDEEDIEKLKNAGIDVSDYFLEMSDGTYTLTSNAEEFNRIVNSITLEALKKQVLDFQNAAGKISEKTGLSNNLIRYGIDMDEKGNVVEAKDAEELGRAQLSYINSFDAGTFDFSNIKGADSLLEKFRENENIALAEQDLQIIADAMGVVNQQAILTESQMFSTATSLSELNGIAIEVGQYSMQAYADGLINLGTSYENCINETEELQKALKSNNVELIYQKQQALELAISIGELSEKYDLNADDIETHAKFIKNSAKDYQLTEKQAINLAVANRRMNKGIATLNENWEDWSKTLKTSDKNSMDYADTLNDTNEALADLVGVIDASSIPLDFFDRETEKGAQHLEWMAAAAEGEAQAINKLGSALAITQVQALEFNSAMTDAYAENFGINPEQAESAFEQIRVSVIGSMTQIHDAIAQGLDNEEIQAKIDSMGSKWIDGLNQMAMATGMSVEKMNSLLNQMGVQAEVEVKNIPQEMQIQGYAEEVHQTGWYDQTYFDYATNDEKTRKMPLYSKYTVPGATKTIKGSVQVAQIKTEDSNLESPIVKYTGTSGGSAGGGSAPSATATKTSSKKNTGPSKSVKPERYKEINDKLDDVANAYEKANKEADRLYGPKQIAKMKEANKELSKEISLLNVKQKQAKDYLEEDKKALKKASADLGLKINIDDNNFITNYTELMNRVDQQLKNAYAKAGDTIDDKEQETIEALEKKVEDFEAAIAQFDETREELEDIENEVLDKIYERQDRNFEILNKELELKIEIDDRALNKLEYYVDKFSDNFYKLAETYELFAKGENSKIATLQNKLGNYVRIDENGNIISSYENDLKDKLNKGEISQANYVEGLKNAETDIRSILGELNSIDKEMWTAYESTLDEASAELEDHVDHIEHLSSVFDHYLNLMDIFGKTKDYESMNDFLSGKAQVTRDLLDIAKEELEIYNQERKEIEQQYNAIKESDNEELKQYWQDQWDAIVDKTDEAQDKVLSLTEEWAENMRAVIENNLAEASDKLEKSLTNGFGFEYLLDQWDKMNTQQEEYLDKTNQIYETNKLMRTAQKAIDETDNKVAKQKLKNFIDETQKLQENTKLSKYELEIRQAQYDLLLAEIALEEAQNAKSTVRLSRDSEGNFGYVYTADQDKIADAQQNVEDKRNEIYNMTLEGQQEYMEKYLQASQEMYEELNALQQDYLAGLITEEEFQIRSDTIRKYYLGSAEFQAEIIALEEAYRNGDIASEEEYNKQRNEIISKYEAKDLGVLNQYIELAGISDKIAKEEEEKLRWANYNDEEKYNEEKQKLTSTYATSNSGIINDFLDFYNKESAKTNDNVSEYWDDGLNSISHNTSNWVNDIGNYLEIVEDGVKDWAETYEEANDDVGNALENSADATEDLIDESEDLKYEIINRVVPGIKTEIKEVSNLITEYGKFRDELQKVIDKYEQYLNTLGKTIDVESGKEENVNDTLVTNTDNSSNNNSDPMSNYNQQTLSSDAKKEGLKNRAKKLIDLIHTTKLDDKYRGSWISATKDGVYGSIYNNEEVINMASKALNDSKEGSGYDYDLEKAKQLINSYDTGGYTGIWGPEGKLAFLHEKEIVLNKDDTENLLKTVSFIRELVNMIDSQASMSSLFSMTATSGVLTGNTGMEQQITIYADFPDATDHNEIEMAFSTLLNTASQYANRK